MSINKFYEDKKIKEVKEDGNHVVLSFVDSKVPSLRLTKKMYDVSVTDAKSDATSVKRVQLHAVVKDILTIMLIWDIKVEDVNMLLNLIVQSLNENQKQAVDKLYGVKEEKRHLSDIDNVLSRETYGEEKGQG